MTRRSSSDHYNNMNSVFSCPTEFSTRLLHEIIAARVFKRHLVLY